MRKVNISYPVISWGRSVIEVDDDATEDEILDALYDGSIEFSIDEMDSHIPVADLMDWREETCNSEIPQRMEVEDL